MIALQVALALGIILVVKWSASKRTLDIIDEGDMKRTLVTMTIQYTLLVVMTVTLGLSLS